MKAVSVILNYIEGDNSREGLVDTPKRVIESFEEIYEGYAMQHGMFECNIGGNDLTKLLMAMLQDNTTFHTHTDLWHTSDNTVFGM